MTNRTPKAEADAAEAPTILTDLAPQPAPVFSEPDKNEMRWRTEHVGDKFRVHVINAAAESFNTLAASEDEGKKALLNALGVK